MHDESTDDGKLSALDVEPNTSWEDEGTEDNEEKSFAKLREWVSRLGPPRAIYWMSKATDVQEAAMQRLVGEFHREHVPSCWLFVQRGCDSTAFEPSLVMTATPVGKRKLGAFSSTPGRTSLKVNAKPRCSSFRTFTTAMRMLQTGFSTSFACVCLSCQPTFSYLLLLSGRSCSIWGINWPSLRRIAGWSWTTLHSPGNGQTQVQISPI